MKDIEFTQYLRPHGRREIVSIERPDDIAAKADEIIAAGFRLECEMLTTGHVSLTIAGDDDDYSIVVCGNGKEVPANIDKLITEFDIPSAVERQRAMSAAP